MSKYNYQTNCGQYVLHDGDQPIGPVMDEVAIAFSIDAVDKMFTLHKHGSPENVKAWLENAQAKLRSKGDAFGREMADELQMIQGRLDIATVNDALAGAHGKLLRLIENISLPEASTRVIEDGATPGKLVELMPLDSRSAGARRIAP